MSKTTTYEVVGNYVRETNEGSPQDTSVFFYPILNTEHATILNDNKIHLGVGAVIPRNRMTENENIVVKPSLEEFKANVLKVMGVTASGGRRSRKTRRRHK